jgi:hypothetical protein
MAAFGTIYPETIAADKHSDAYAMVASTYTTVA